jgi:3-hydroxymyristoyl/3-hydroxydecanoyl-(acyl carrier protein) dehydratase
VLFENHFLRDVSAARATAVFPAEWPLFAGHFPGQPIVPAYALVGFVLAHCEHALGGPGELASLDRMKLSRGLGPGEPVSSELAIEKRQDAVVTVRSRLSSADSSEIGVVILSMRVGA